MDEQQSKQAAALPNAADDQVRYLYLARLQHLVNIRESGASLDPANARLLDFAAYSTYQDCAEFGMRAIARRILHLPSE